MWKSLPFNSVDCRDRATPLIVGGQCPIHGRTRWYQKARREAPSLHGAGTWQLQALPSWDSGTSPWQRIGAQLFRWRVRVALLASRVLGALDKAESHCCLPKLCRLCRQYTLGLLGLHRSPLLDSQPMSACDFVLKGNCSVFPAEKTALKTSVR